MLDMASLTATIDGAMIGTPAYFSPEQFKGTKRDIDHRTDLYAKNRVDTLARQCFPKRGQAHD